MSSNLHRAVLRPFNPIGLGTVKLGRDKGVKYPHGFRMPNQSEAGSLLALAKDLGISLLDTAPAYGDSEERLGELLRGQRDHWILCTKAGEEYDPSTGRSHFDFSSSHLRYSVERSLKRLRTDAVDILLLHSDGRDEEIINVHRGLETLGWLKTEGKVRAIGMSTKTVEGGLLALESVDYIMVTYNPLAPEQLTVIERAAARGKAVLVKKPFASGSLCLGGPAGAHDALRFSLGNPDVTAVIVGTINPVHLRENVRTAKNILASSRRVWREPAAGPGSHVRYELS